MNCRPDQLPHLSMDELLTHDELRQLLGRHGAAKLLRGPFCADPDACPARIAVGLTVLEHVAHQGIDDLIAIAIGEAALRADPQQHRFLMGVWHRGKPGAVFLSGELLHTETAAAAALRLGVVLADRWPVPADTLAFDVLDRLARLRAAA